MQLEFGYRSGVQTVELPQENLLGVLHAAPILVGRECYETVRCIDSDAADCIHLGDTAHGTPVDITRAVAEADFRICLGNIEFHYFAGYSGGAYSRLVPSWRTAPVAITQSPARTRRSMPPAVPTRMKVSAPTANNSSIAIALDGPPMPVEQTLTRSPSRRPV